MIGQELHSVAKLLFPICRSITGNGVRETLAILSDRFVPFDIHEVRSGTSCFDWTIPQEWNIDHARLIGPDGGTIVDFRDNSLHVVGYSEPIDTELELDELQDHLYSSELQPNAIPYVTSYYRRHWGFCLPHAQRARLKPGRYRAIIESRFSEGSLTYGDLIIPGSSPKEILLSSYICHPSMANNELSGPLVVSALARWLSQRKNRYTYRIALFPETIGSITFLSRHLETLKDNLVAGFHLSCIGDERSYGFIATPSADTLADRIARHVYGHTCIDAIEYDFSERGSDERQFCAPGVALPVVTLMRSKFGSYPEYHTSLDDLTVVTPAGLEGGFAVAKACIDATEANRIYQSGTVGEPFLTKYGLRPTTSVGGLDGYHRTISDILAFSDGTVDLLGICDRIGVPIWEAAPIAETLASHLLLLEQPDPA